MSAPTLEQERQAILERMQARRQNYRRMLQDGDELGQMPTTSQLGSMHTHGFNASPYHPLAMGFEANSVLRVIRDHPLLLALGVATLVAVGPKRLMRGVVSSGTTLTALTARNQSNVDLIGRLLTMAGAYVQGRTK
jgi:hypothetical protein